MFLLYDMEFLTVYIVLILCTITVTLLDHALFTPAHTTHL